MVLSDISLYFIYCLSNKQTSQIRFEWVKENEVKTDTYKQKGVAWCSLTKLLNGQNTTSTALFSLTSVYNLVKS